MKLDTVRGIVTEQGRIYRLWVNGKIKPDEMSRGIGSLSQIRQSIESLPPEPVADQAPPIVNIVSVPANYFVTNQSHPSGENQLVIAHEINPELSTAPIKANDQTEIYIPEEEKAPIDVPEFEPAPVLETIDAAPEQPLMKDPVSGGWSPVPPRQTMRPPGRKPFW